MWKWLIAIIIPTTLLLIPAVVLADTSTDITITATGYVVGAPRDFTLTYINDYEVGISWTKAETANITMIRAKYGSYPKDRFDGYLVYCGTGNYTSDTAVNFYDYVGKIRYAAWSWSENITGGSDGWSPNSAQAELEGIAVIDLVEQISIFNEFMPSILMQIIGFLVLASIVALAFWHRDRLLYVLAGLALLGYGAMQFGNNIYIGLILIILGIYCFVKAAWDRRRA